MFDTKPAYPLSELHAALKEARVIGASEVMSLRDVHRISNERALREIVSSRIASSTAYLLAKDSIIDRSMAKNDMGYDGVEYRLELAVMPAKTWRQVQNLLAILVEREALAGNMEVTS